MPEAEYKIQMKYRPTEKDLYVSMSLGEVTMSHIRILQLISKLTFCETDTLKLALVHQCRTNSSKYKCIDFIDEKGRIVNEKLEQLYEILEELEKWGLIHRFTYKPFSSKKLSYYCCTSLGYIFLRKELEGEEKFFDSHLALTPPEKIMQHLAAVSCLFAIDGIIDFSTDVTFEMKNKEKRKLFVEADRIDKNGVEQTVLFEPIFASYNKEKYDKGNIAEIRQKRVAVLKEYISSKALSGSFVVVLVCDSFDGMKEIFKVLRDNFSNSLDNFYITCNFLEGSMNERLLKVVSFTTNDKGITTPELVIGDL